MCHVYCKPGTFSCDYIFTLKSMQINVGKRVGRSSELKLDEVIEQVDSRTIAAAPLPYDVKLEDVESFFAKLAKVPVISIKIENVLMITTLN